MRGKAHYWLSCFPTHNFYFLIVRFLFCFVFGIDLFLSKLLVFFFLSREAVYVYFDCVFEIGSRVQAVLELAVQRGWSWTLHLLLPYPKVCFCRCVTESGFQNLLFKLWSLPEAGVLFRTLLIPARPRVPTHITKMCYIYGVIRTLDESFRSDLGLCRPGQWKSTLNSRNPMPVKVCEKAGKSYQPENILKVK